MSYALLAKREAVIWAYRAQLTQGTTTTDAEIAIDITPNKGSPMRILSIILGKDDYGTAKGINVKKIDENLANLDFLMSDVIDNAHILGPIQAVGSNTDTSPFTTDGVNANGRKTDEDIIANPDILRVNALDLIPTETLTVSIRALILHKPPTAAAFGNVAGLDDSTGGFYNKVIR